MDISKAQDYIYGIPCKVIKYTNELAEGYVCLKRYCNRYDVYCSECNWNTKTPYFYIGGTQFYVTRDECYYVKTTGFNPDESFYILIKGTSEDVDVKFISEEEFQTCCKAS